MNGAKKRSKIVKIEKPNLPHDENEMGTAHKTHATKHSKEGVKDRGAATFTPKLIVIALLLISASHLTGFAQETYGKTLNIGLGVGGYSGYYGHVGRSLPVFHVDYEFDVAKDFTLAPFINIYSFSNDYYWGNNNNPYKNYSYRETVIPIGAKGTYYFDDLLNATSPWDFYLAGSLGFAIVSSSWDAGYNGDRNYYRSPSSLFLDIHIGTEYHFNKKVGAFLDLSSGVSTIGIAIHGIK